MILTKKGNKIARVAALSVMSVSFSFMAHFTYGAAALYFDNNGTGSGYGTANNGTYNWDGTTDGGEWATASGGTTATGPWVQGSAAVFNQTASPTTVTVSVDEKVANQTVGTLTEAVDYAQTTGAYMVSIAQAPSTTGDLDIGSVSANFYIADTSGTLAIDAPIVGTGGTVVQHGGGTLALYGANTFSGGMEVTGGQLTYYNNSQSFGTGNIIIGGGLSNAFLSGAGSQVTIPNNWTISVDYPINLVGGNGTLASPGTIFSGNFPLTSGATQNIETSITTTTVDEMSGVISGSSTAEVEFSDTGTMILTGPNTYKGITLISSSLNTASPPTLVLGAAGTIASSSEVILSGGKLNPDGLNQIMSSTTLDLTASSIIDYGVGAAEIDFANSSALAWTGTLNLANFTPGVDFLRFDSGPSGLTSTQLADIEYDGNAATLGTAVLDSNGYVEFPEPASLSLLGLGALSLLARRRK
jgi:fibronectin-binding autotransporter adhesin